MGPRIIPYFKDIIKECVGVLGNETSPGHAESIGVLHALLTSIPNFWSSGDFLLIIELYLRQHVSAAQHNQAQLSSFVKALAKRAPSKVLLPTLCDLWSRLAADKVHPCLIFYLLPALTVSSAGHQSDLRLPICAAKDRSIRRQGNTRRPLAFLVQDLPRDLQSVLLRRELQGFCA